MKGVWKAYANSMEDIWKTYGAPGTAVPLAGAACGVNAVPWPALALSPSLVPALASARSVCATHHRASLRHSREPLCRAPGPNLNQNLSLPESGRLRFVVKICLWAHKAFWRQESGSVALGWKANPSERRQEVGGRWSQFRIAVESSFLLCFMGGVN